MKPQICEKILDQYLDSNVITADMQMHINSCPDCQATFNKLRLLDNSPSPTQNIGNPDEFIKNFNAGTPVNSSLGTKLPGSLKILALSGLLAAGVYFGAHFSSQETKLERTAGEKEPGIEKITQSDDFSDESVSDLPTGHDSTASSSTDSSKDPASDKTPSSTHNQNKKASDTILFRPAPTGEVK